MSRHIRREYTEAEAANATLVEGDFIRQWDEEYGVYYLMVMKDGSQAKVKIRGYATYFLGCQTCERELAAGNTFFPPHVASDRCESGKYNHCTCDTCF